MAAELDPWAVPGENDRTPTRTAQHYSAPREPSLNHQLQDADAYAAEQRRSWRHETYEEQRQRNRLKVLRATTAFIVGVIVILTIVTLKLLNTPFENIFPITFLAIATVGGGILLDMHIREAREHHPSLAQALRVTLLVTFALLAWSFVVYAKTQRNVLDIEISQLKDKVAEMEKATAAAPTVNVTLTVVPIPTVVQ